MDPNKNHRNNNTDEGSNECNETDNQDKFPQTQNSSRRSVSSRKSQSRPTSKAASIGHQSGTRSNPQSRSKLWTSTNPYINFLSDFRKRQSGQKSTLIFRLGGEQWRNMTEVEKQPFVDAANKNKKLKQPQPNKKQQQKQASLDKKQSKTSTDKDIVPNKSSSSRKVPNPRKRKKTQQRPETQLKKKRATSETETDTATDTSGSIHTATTDCASEDSDEST